MDTISIMDGLMLTIVSMLVVFGILATIGGLIVIVSKFIPDTETEGNVSKGSQSAPKTIATPTGSLTPNVEHQQVTDLMALILASEDEPNKKFEITESKRIK